MEFLLAIGYVLLGLALFAIIPTFVWVLTKEEEALQVASVLSLGFWLITAIVWVAITPTEYSEPPAWDKCVNQANRLYDNFNDTVGASYAHQDQPAKEVQNFIDKCVEANTPPKD